MIKSKKDIAYKVRYAPNKWKVYSWDTNRQIYVENCIMFSYWVACEIVREYQKIWSTRKQAYFTIKDFLGA